MRDRSVWVVDNDETIEQGTAFFLAGIGLVTAEHCVTKTSEVEVYHPSKPANKFKAQVKYSHVARDLAILEHTIPVTEFFEMELATAPCALGDQVTAIGYPEFAPGDGINVRAGTVNAFKVRSGVQQIEVSQKLTHGMSGGPIVNNADKVIGVVHRGGDERNFGIASKELTDWVSEIPK